MAAARRESRGRGLTAAATRRPLRIPTPDETASVLDAAEGPCRIALVIAATTGLRRSEVLRLRRSDIDADELHVREGKRDQARRSVSLTPVTIAALRRHPAEQVERRLICGEGWTDLDLVVDRGDGGAVHPDVMTRAFERAAERAELEGIRLPDLRQAYASTLLRAGVHVKLVSASLGHAKSSFTLDVYGHLLPGAGEAVASAIEAALGASLGAGRPNV